MRSPKLFGPVAVAVLAVVAFLPPAPAAAQHERISAPAQSVEPASPPPPAAPEPPPPPPAPEPPPPPPPETSAPQPYEPSAQPPSPEPSEPAVQPSAPPAPEPPPEALGIPTDPGTAGRRISIEPLPPPTDPGTVGRRIPPPAPPPPSGGGEPPFCPPYLPDGTLLGDMTTFAEAPPPAAMATLVQEVDAGLVEVQVFVSDPAGKPVAGLQKDDFLLFVDGLAVPIASFYAQTASAAPGTDRTVLERLIGLETFYSLGFVPARPSDGREHRIAVVVKGRPGLTVRAGERRPEEG